MPSAGPHSRSFSGCFSTIQHRLHLSALISCVCNPYEPPKWNLWVFPNLDPRNFGEDISWLRNHAFRGHHYCPCLSTKWNAFNFTWFHPSICHIFLSFILKENISSPSSLWKFLLFIFFVTRYLDIDRNDRLNDVIDWVRSYPIEVKDKFHEGAST